MIFENENPQIKIPKPRYFSLEATAHSHGWIQLSPFHWDSNRKTVSLIFSLGKEIFRLVIWETRDAINILSDHGKIKERHQIPIQRVVSRILSLDFNMPGFASKCRSLAPKLLPYVRRGHGRILRSPTAWEDAAKTLCTTNASWSFTLQMCERLCREIGRGGAFPTPAEVFDAGEKELTRIKLGYRADYLFHLANKIIKKELDLSSLEKGVCDYASAASQVKDLRGFGLYAQRHLLVLLGWHECLPVDREVEKYLTLRGSKKEFIKADKLYANWEENRFTAYKIERTLSASDE
jgi:3-methyladenine DNA glycosylase/8-oxoguanine DNA glycosylase